jgi:parallel beta-helix repeat protein
VTLRDVKVYSNRKVGISAKTATLTIASSRIGDNKEDGLLVTDAKVEIKENTVISGNDDDGISAGGSAQVTLTDSQVSGNISDGLFLGDSARATLTNSQVSGNGGAGLFLGDSAQASLENNTIERNQGCGIFSVSDQLVQGRANRMRDNGNDLCGNLSAKLRVPLRPETEQELRWPAPGFASLQEAVDALRPGGVLLLAPGSEQIGGVTIAKPITILVEPVGEAAVVKGRTGRVPVLSLVEGAVLKIWGLKITGGAYGLMMGANAQATLTDSTVSENCKHRFLLFCAGLFLGDSAQATLTNSQVSGNGDNGLVLRNSAQVEVRNSTIEGNTCHGLLAVDKARVTLEGSRILGNILKGCSNRETHGGVEILESAQAVIRGNVIQGNHNFGIELDEQAQAVIENNEIKDNDRWGVMLWQAPCFETDKKFSGKVEGSGNTIEGNGKQLSQQEKDRGDGKGDVCPKELEFLKKK